MMRWLARVLATLVVGGCKSATPAAGTVDEVTYHSAATLAEDDVYKPSYDKTDLQQALAAERAAVAQTEQQLQASEGTDYDQLRVATADLDVRKRFIASLETCEATGRVCPPRLDDPPWSFDIEAETDPKLDVTLRFDQASWQKVAAELHGRACACRTIACVDSMFVAIDKLEKRPMPDVQADETASLSIVRARDCLYRLRGLRPTPRAD